MVRAVTSPSTRASAGTPPDTPIGHQRDRRARSSHSLRLFVFIGAILRPQNPLSSDRELHLASWNLWGDSRWAERRHSVELMLRRLAPDVLGIQELSPTNAAAVDQILVS